MISIPKQFQLGGRTWKVGFFAMLDGDPDMYGDCDNTTCKIRVKMDPDPHLMWHSFYHELCHAICFTLGWTKLNKDEDKIDALANVLLQYMQTSGETPTE